MSETKHTSRRSGRTRDARGKVVSLLDPVPLYILGREDVIDRNSLEAVMTDLDPALAATGAMRTRRRFGIIVISAVIVLAVIAQVAIIASGDKSALRMLTRPYFYLPIIVGMVLPFFITRAERMKKLKRVMLSHRLCPHCGYNLRGREPENDEATVCSECGCAWNVAVVAAATSTGMTDDMRSSNRRFMILLIAGLTIFALGVIAFLVYEFTN